MVSVIIPVYNGEAYIDACLSSLLSDGGEGLEVIAVNDGSKDGTSRLLHEFASRFSCLRVIDQENGGAAQARRTGIEAARGDFIGFLDVDDRAEARMYLDLEARALASGADIVFCNYTAVYPTRSEVVRNRLSPDQTFPMEGETVMTYLHRRQAYFPFPWNKVYRAELLRSVGFPSGNFVGEDYDMQLRLLEAGARVDYLDCEGYFYVMTENSASRGGYGPGTVLAYDRFRENYRLVCEAYPEKEREAAHYLMIEYMAMVIAMGRNRTYNRPMIREIKRFVRGHLRGFLGASYVSLTMKGSALALTVSYRLLIGVYRLLGR